MDQLQFLSDYPWLSLFPSVLAIFLAIRTKQVFISLLFGIWLGWLILSDFNFLQGTLGTIQALVDVFKDAGNTRTIMFCALAGSLIILIQRSGGVQGFINAIQQYLERYENKEGRSSKVIVQLLAWLTGVLIFVESNISVLVVGTLYRPIFDKMKISREKLAYIADSSSAPASIMVPFNGWGAFIMSLLAAEGFDNSFDTLLHSMAYNFYPMLALVLVVVIILFKKDFSYMAKAEERVNTTGEFFFPNSQPMMADELTDVETKPGVIPKAINMVLPIVIMVLFMPIMLAYTGWDTAFENNPNTSFLSTAIDAIRYGSGSTAVLVAVLGTLLFTMISYRSQGILGIKEMIDIILKGIAGMVPLALLMMMAFAIGTVCKQMETGIYVADITQSWLSPSLVPALVFVISCFIAFSTGTSWGTFAIMIAIAVPMAEKMDANVYMAIAAAIGGGVYGDHCSPISDTTILASMASATDHIDHVKTQLPYASIAGGLSLLLYLLLGMV